MTEDNKVVGNDNVKVALVDDDKVFHRMVDRTLSEHENLIIDYFSSANDFLNQLHNNPDIVIIDYKLPDILGIELLKKVKSYNDNIKVVVVSGQSDAEVVVKAYKKGADDYIIKNEACLPELESTLKNFTSHILLYKEMEQLKSEVLDRQKYTQIIGNSPAILKVLRNIQKAEKTNIIVMITGDSGTGKELTARAIHYNSPRKKQPFIPVNVAAIPNDLIESELFGHEKGAFTGAISRRIGKFEEAHKGTIFLDEIGEMDLSLQAKLLRILEDKQVVRIGSNKPIELDIRIIAATNKDLFEEVQKGNFREDLFYRLQGFLIHMPTLKERRDDIILLSKYLLKEFINKNNMPEVIISKEAMEVLQSYSWPGNVRELKSVMERAALLSNNKTITPNDLLLTGRRNSVSLLDEELTMEQYKKKIIKEFLNRYDNNVDLVARKLDVGRATIYRFLKKIAN